MFKDEMKCRACLDPTSIESESHICENCEFFVNERETEKLDIRDVFGPLDAQVNFIRKFKVYARKWKLFLEIQSKPS